MTRLSHFFKGVDLSMVCMLQYLGKAFHLWSHLLCILVFWAWKIAEMLAGRSFLSGFGREWWGLVFPLATCLAFVLAFLWGKNLHVLGPIVF